MKLRRNENEDSEDTKRGRHNPNELDNEYNKNTLITNLPDSILLHILSFLNVKDAIQTCLVSSTWKHLWKHLPTFTLSSSDFNNHKDFTNFVNTFLSFRDSSTVLNALDFECEDCAEPHLLNRIVTYAVSHNVNRLHLDCPIHHIPFPPSLFSCQSLTSLALGYPITRVIFPSSLNLPALTYLKLVYVSFCSGKDGQVDPFSTFNRLNTLILDDYRVQDAKPLCISSTMILNLSIHTGWVPQRRSNIVLFAPSLNTFAFTCNPFDKLTWNHLSSIKQVSIDILFEIHYSVENSFRLLNWLKEITEIESLTITPKTLRALSLIPDILKLKLPFLCNMKSLQLNLRWDAHRFYASSWRDIKMELAGDKSWKENAKLPEAIQAGLDPRYSSIMDGMIGFLLQNSPLAKVDIVKFPLI